jgi:hypothetical protein
MNLFTSNQKKWFFKKNIKVGDFYMFPRFGFWFYSEPSEISCEYFESNPFTKSLDNQMFLVKSIENGFCKGNFYEKPLPRDFYLKTEELSSRNTIEVVFLFVICSIPMIIYNFFQTTSK